VLRLIGGLDLLALLAVGAPRWAIALAHEFLGLGPLPEGAIVGYLARSASALYALHGALALFVSFDLERYLPLIRCMALIALLHGAIMLSIDLREGMPLWWTLFEGPSFGAMGALVLLLLSGAQRS
jgi:hypothetical protein